MLAAAYSTAYPPVRGVFDPATGKNDDQLTETEPQVLGRVTPFCP